MFGQDKSVYANEANYNFSIVFPILKAIIQSIPGTTFVAGEIKLQAISSELLLLKNDTTNFYNADGIIYNDEDIELVLLETAGAFHVPNNIAKETKDYIKAGYGLMAMLHTIGRLYKYAPFELFKGLSVYFVQATATKLRVWSFSLVADKLYAMNCIGKVLVPDCATDNSCEARLRQVVNVFWFLREKIEESQSILQQLKVAHRGVEKRI